jgi:hypothetical protein
VARSGFVKPVGAVAVLDICIASTGIRMGNP